MKQERVSSKASPLARPVQNWGKLGLLVQKLPIQAKLYKKAVARNKLRPLIEHLTRLSPSISSEETKFRHLGASVFVEIPQKAEAHRY